MNAGPLSLRRVAYLHNGDKYGGMEKNTLLLLRHLDRKRYEPIVLVPGYFYDLDSTRRFRDEVTAMGVRLYRTPESNAGGWKRYLRDVRRLVRMFRELSIDLIHIQTSEAFSGRLATVAAAACRLPVLRTEHIPPGSYVTDGDWRRVWLFDKLTRRIVVDSDANLEEQVERLRRSRRRLVRAHTGIELDSVRPGLGVRESKLKIGLDPDRPVVGAVGRLEEQKGMRYLVEAARPVLKAHQGAQFVIVGDGPLRKELEEIASSLDLGDHLVFAGFQQDYITYMQAMDVGVMPSLFEGFSLSMLEFMALGKAMVFSDHSSFKEAVTDGAEALIVPKRDAHALAQAIIRLLDSLAERERLGSAIRHRMGSAFSIQRLTADMMRLYDEALPG